MDKRVCIAKVLLTVGSGLLVAAIFLPVVCFFAWAGGALIGGCASLWEISSVASSAMIVVVVATTGVAMRRQNEELSSQLVTAGLFLGVTWSTGITLLVLGILPIHPYALGTIMIASCIFVVAAFVAKTPGQPMRFQFHLRTLLICVTIVALLLGAVVRS